MIPLKSSVRVYRPAVVVTSLIVLNLVIFLYEAAMDPAYLNYFILRHGMVPDHFRWINLLTSMFLHGGWLHVIGNMWFLWVYGRNVEDIMGSGRFLLFYLICGIFAGFVHILFNYYSRVPTVGASGAIAGVMGAYLIRFPRAYIVTLVPVFIFITTMDIPAWLLLIYWFAIQFFSGFGSIGDSAISHGGTAWFAHIGGFLAGMLLVNAMVQRPRYQSWRE
jgi:membrane associated rhomboid family serine protease